MFKIKKDTLFVLISIVLSVILLVSLYIILDGMSDRGCGMDASDSTAYLFVRESAKQNSGRLDKLVLPPTRSAGFLLDTMCLSPIEELRKQYADVDIYNIVIDSVEDLSDRVDKIESGYFSIYNKSMKFSDARRYILRAIALCTPKDPSVDADGSDPVDVSDTTVDPVKFDVNYNVITVKLRSNDKWYVYTGQQLAEDLDRTDADLVNVAPFTGYVSYDSASDDRVFDIMYTKIKSVSKDVKKLNFYRNAVDDLCSGKISIDSFEYFVPISYQSIMNFITINDSKLTEEDKVIPPNSVLRRVPVVFTNVIYSKTGISVNISNPTNSPIDIYGGTISGLYLSIPSQDIYDYPDVYLPGNVTFGTDFTDVSRMYGGLEPYTGNDSNLKTYSSRAKIFVKSLNNEKNHVYFEFEDNKLVAIQYCYLDLMA